MTKKTRHTKKRSSRRKTLRRRKTRRGGAFSIPDTGHSQKIVMPTSSFGKDIGTPGLVRRSAYTNQDYWHPEADAAKGLGSQNNQWN